MEKLDDRIKAHDKDIERMCNHHYQGFIDSIRELLQVRSQAQQLNVSFYIYCYIHHVFDSRMSYFIQQVLIELCMLCYLLKR